MNPIRLEDISQILKADLNWSIFDGASVLVTGGGGFLASYMIDSMMAMASIKGFGPSRVICLARTPAKAEARFHYLLDREELQIVSGDIITPPDIPGPIDIIIHAASIANTLEMAAHPADTLSANIIGTREMLNLARRHKSRRMMFFSSGAAAAQELILAPIRPAPFAPYSLEDARACYAEAKRAGEALCQAWTQQYGVETRIVRPMHTYGYGMNLEGGWIHSDFIKDILAKRDLVISGDGMAGRAFCYITDAALAYFTVLIKGRAAHPYPVGTDTVIRMSELGQILADEFRLRVIIKKPIGDRPIPPMEPSPDISATTSLGWAPTTSIRDGFRRTVAAYRHELEGI